MAGTVGAVVEGVHVAADGLRLGEQLGRNAFGVGGRVDYRYRSELVTGFLAATDEGPDKGTSYYYNAIANAATAGAKPLIEAGVRAYDANDLTIFGEAYGGFAVGVVSLKMAADGLAAQRASAMRWNPKELSQRFPSTPQSPVSDFAKPTENPSGNNPASRIDSANDPSPSSALNKPPGYTRMQDYIHNLSGPSLPTTTQLVE